MKLCRLSTAGINEFRAFLNECRDKPSMDIDRRKMILKDRRYSLPVEKDIDISEKMYTSRRDMAETLERTLAPLNEDTIETDSGLWSWLSLFFFDSVCPYEQTERKVKDDPAYILVNPSSASYNLQTRHLLYTSWYLLRLSKKYHAEEYATLWLDDKLYTQNSLLKETIRRLVITRLPCFFELIYRLYWNEQTSSLRRGIMETHRNEVRCGDLTHRLPSCLNQLALTYDLHNLNALQLIELLGDEFLPENIGRKTLNRE